MKEKIPVIQPKRPPRVTVILSTYNRPASLRVAVRSVLLQTIADWKLLVIGDHCDNRTADVMRSFSDDRICYVNLPVRCGEQSIPNSIGMTLADTDYIALLNHDDILLRNHLEVALALFEQSDAELFVGQAAFSRYSQRMPDGRQEPVFSEINPAKRHLMDVFLTGFESFEPCSTWVFRRQLVEKVGVWQHSRTIYRSPMEDWLLRVWRSNISVALADGITVLRLLNHYQQQDGANAYDWEGREYEFLEALLLSQPVGKIREIIADQLTSDAARKMPRADLTRLHLVMTPDEAWLAERLLTHEMADVFSRTGWDAFTQFCLLTGREKGFFLKKELSRRTGEALPEDPDYPTLLANIREQIAKISGGADLPNGAH